MNHDPNGPDRAVGGEKPRGARTKRVRVLTSVLVVAVVAAAGFALVQSSDDPASSEQTSTSSSEGPAASEADEISGADETSDGEASDVNDGESTDVPVATELRPSETDRFGAGTLLVGNGVLPGRYVAQVPDGSEGCVWDRLVDLEARYQESVASDVVGPGGQAIVEITVDDEAFRSSGCGEWVTYEPPAEPSEQFGEGTWIVGEQIVAGEYTSAGAVQDGVPCSWERRLGFSGEFFDILESGSSEGAITVELEEGDVNFTSSGCRSWELDS